MAKNDVQINIIGKDSATPAFKSVADAASSTTRSMEEMGNSAVKVNTILSSMVGFGLAQAGMEGLSDAFHSSIGNALDYYKTMQTGQIAVAGTLMSVGYLNGKQIEWNQSLQMSTQIMKDLSDQAIRTGVSTQSFVSVFRAALPSALKSGMSIPQFEELLGPLMTEGKMLELPEVSLVRDVSDLMLGNNANRTKLANVLGITDKDIKNAQSQNKLYDLLKNRLQGELMSNKQYLGTWEGTTNYMKEALSRAGGTAAAPAFEKMKEDIHDIADSLIHVNKETKEITLDPEAQKIFKEITDDAIAFEGQLRLIGSDFMNVFSPALEAGAYAAGFLARNLDTVARIYAAYFVASKVKKYWDDYQNGITGAAKANTVFGKSAEKARAEILAQEAASVQAQRVANAQAASQTASKVTGTVGAYSSSGAVQQQELAKSAATANVALKEQAVIGVQAGEAVTTGAVAGKTAQGELAAQTVYTTEAMGTQAEAARVNAAQNVAGAAAVKTAQAETNAVVLAGAGAHATTGRAAAKTAETTITGLAKAQIMLKASLSGILALAGGWLGVAAATGIAISAYMDYRNQQLKEDAKHTQYINGHVMYADKDGNFYEKKTVGGLGSHIEDTVKFDPDQETQKAYWAAEEENKKQWQIEEQNKISSMVKETSAGIEKQIGDITYNPNLPNDEDEKAKKAADKAASAQQKYANTIQSNADLIEKANEKMRNIIASLEEQIMNFTGSQYDIDIAGIKKQYLSNLKSINDDTVKLRVVSLGTIRSMNAVGKQNGTASVEVPQSNNDMVSIIEQASQKLGFDPKLALAIAMRESGGDTLGGITNDAYNSKSGATGAFQILDGQDVADGNGGRVSISDLYPEYKTDPTENALAGITMLIDKINEAGDTWEGVKNYGEGTEEYVQAIRDNYNAIQSGVDLAPTTYEKYTPSDATKAKSLNETYYQEAMNKATRDWLIRVRKQYSETAQTRMALPGTEDQAGLIEEQYKEFIAEINDKKRDLLKSVGGSSSDPQEKARAEAQVQEAMNAETLKAEHEKEQKLRALRQQEYEDQVSYIDSMAYLDDDYQAHTDSLHKSELESIIEYDREQLQSAKLTQAERIELEKDYVEKKKEYEETAKKDFNEGLKYMYKQMKLYTQDSGTALSDGWSTIASDITSSFDNMLTENESGAKRLENLYVNIGNTILNTMMKIILQGLIMNSIMKAFGLGSSSLSSNYSSLGITSVSGDAYSLQNISTYSGSAYAADGGYITGPGTTTSDSIPAWLSNKEYVVSAKGVQNVGTSFLDAINNGYVKRFANGGAVSGASSGSYSESKPNIKISITNQTGSSISADQTGVSFDGESYVMGIVLKSISTNKFGSRTILKGLSK